MCQNICFKGEGITNIFKSATIWGEATLINNCSHRVRQTPATTTSTLFPLYLYAMLMRIVSIFTLSHTHTLFGFVSLFLGISWCLFVDFRFNSGAYLLSSGQGFTSGRLWGNWQMFLMSKWTIFELEWPKTRKICDVGCSI